MNKKSEIKISVSLDDINNLASFETKYNELKSKYEELTNKYENLNSEKVKLEDKLSQFESNFEPIKESTCTLCKKTFKTKGSLLLHFETKKHIEKVEENDAKCNNKQVPGCLNCRNDAYVCSGHCKECKISLRKYQTYCTSAYLSVLHYAFRQKKSECDIMSDFIINL